MCPCEILLAHGWGGKIVKGVRKKAERKSGEGEASERRRGFSSTANSAAAP